MISDAPIIMFKVQQHDWKYGPVTVMYEHRCYYIFRSWTMHIFCYLCLNSISWLKGPALKALSFSVMVTIHFEYNWTNYDVHLTTRWLKGWPCKRCVWTLLLFSTSCVHISCYYCLLWIQIADWRRRHCKNHFTSLWVFTMCKTERIIMLDLHKDD